MIDSQLLKTGSWCPQLNFNKNQITDVKLTELLRILESSTSIGTLAQYVSQTNYNYKWLFNAITGTSEF